MTEAAEFQLEQISQVKSLALGSPVNAQASW